MLFEHNSVPKNLFLSACFYWDSGLSLREMNEKLKFGGLIGYGNSYFDYVFHYSKLFRLHGKLHDAAGAVLSHSGKGPGYCYMIGRGPIFCLLGQKLIYGGTIGCGDSYLEFLFRHFKVFRLHAILHDAAGTVRAHSGKALGYCYMIERGPNSCLLGHVTGLLFCL